MLFASIIGISQFINTWSHLYVPFTRAPQEPIVQVTHIPSASTSLMIDCHDIEHNKCIALTFDDGPYGTSTSQILNILKKEQVLATFFLIGKNAELHSDQVRQEIALGEVIGNHSYSHSQVLSTMSSSTLREDITHAQRIIENISGVSPHLFRPPYSRTSPAMVTEITREGYVFAGWNIDPRDWDNSNSSTSIVTTVLTHAKPNSIVIFHDGHEYGTDYSRQNTIDALPQVISLLKKQGYTFVTLDRILSTNPYRSL